MGSQVQRSESETWLHLELLTPVTSPSTRHGNCQTDYSLDLTAQSKFLCHAGEADEHLILALHKPANQELTPEQTNKWIWDLKYETVLAVTDVCLKRTSRLYKNPFGICIWHRYAFCSERKAASPFFSQSLE